MSQLDPIATTHHQDAIGQIESILESNFYSLRFPRELEKQYRRYFASRYLQYNRLTVLLGLLMVFALGALDMLFLKEQLVSVLLIRYVGAGPFLLALFALSLTQSFQRHQQSILAAIMISIASVMVVLIAIAPPAVARLYFSGLLLVIIFGFCLARLFFWYALCIAILIGGMYNAALYWMNPETFDFWLAHNFFYWGACLLALICNYFLEHGIRTEYLQAQLLKYQKEDLQYANEQLQKLALMDGLTGIANRRHFDETFEHEWRRAQRLNHTLAILMIDIDFFKRYNDTYGHQAGDECLSKVAACLRVCLKRPGDMVARYGGEEFVALLPEVNEQGASAMALHMCQEIEALGIEHEASGVKPVVTISVGAAVTIPTQGMSPAQLLAKADDALYDAKMAGRNQVVIVNN